jgi:hypothetical protein
VEAGTEVSIEVTPTVTGTHTPLPEIEATPEATEDKPPSLPTKELPVPVTPNPGAANALPDDLLTAIKADAANKAGADSAQVEVISVEEVTWNDGSLGCPQPGMMYTQARVPGYKVIVKVGDQQFTYHAAQRGSFVECKPFLIPSKPNLFGSPKPPVSPGDPTK